MTSIEDRVDGMVWWLTSQLATGPADVAPEPYPEPYPYGDDDLLGERVSDALHEEWLADTDSMAITLKHRIRDGLRRRGNPAAAPMTQSSVAGRVVWSVPAFAPYVLPASVLRKLTGWIDSHGLLFVSGHHPVTVEQQQHDGQLTIVYQRGVDHFAGTTETRRVPMRVEPPTIPDLPDLSALGAVLLEHPPTAAGWRTNAPPDQPVCRRCAVEGRAHIDDVGWVAFPCSPVRAAAAVAGVEVYPRDDEVEASRG